MRAECCETCGLTLLDWQGVQAAAGESAIPFMYGRLITAVAIDKVSFSCVRQLHQMDVCHLPTEAVLLSCCCRVVLQESVTQVCWVPG